MGGRVETALDNNWSARFEARYVDLGGFDTAFGGVTNTTVTNALNTPQQGFSTVTTTGGVLLWRITARFDMW